MSLVTLLEIVMMYAVKLILFVFHQ